MALQIYHPHHDALRRQKEIERRATTTEKTTVPATPTPTPTHTPAPVKPPPPKPPVKATTPPPPPPVTQVEPTTVTATPPVSIVPITLPPPLNTPIVNVVPSTTSTPSLPFTTSAITSLPSATGQETPSNTSTMALATPTSTAPLSSGGVSTGAVVGSIVGGFVVLGLIGSVLFVFLRRAKKRKGREETMFDKTEFRRSAVMLNDRAEKHGPRRPTMIEQPSQHRPSPTPASYPPSSNARGVAEQAAYRSPYAPSRNESPYPVANGAQAAYGQQYPQASSAYTYADAHEYPPQPQNRIQSPYGTQQFGAHTPPVPPVHRADSASNHTQDDLVLPNPFAASPSQVLETRLTHSSFGASSTSTAPDPRPTTFSSQSQESEEDADTPPPYESTGGFADYRPDVKATLPGLAVTNWGDSGTSGAQAASASQTPNTARAVDSTPQTSKSTSSGSGSSPAPGPSAGEKSHPWRPLSVTSAISTVYDTHDAYGGM